MIVVSNRIPVAAGHEEAFEERFRGSGWLGGNTIPGSFGWRFFDRSRSRCTGSRSEDPSTTWC